MKAQIFTIDYVLWALSIALDLAILAAMVGRGHVRRHPALGAFFAFLAGRSFVLFFVAQEMSAEQYFYAYSAFTVITSLLYVAVLRECCLRIFEPLEGLPSGVVRRLLTQMVVVTTAAIAIGALAHAQNVEGDTVLAGIRSFDVAVRLMCVAAFTLVLAFARNLCLPVRSLTYSAMVGIVFYSAVQTVVSYLMARNDMATNALLRPLGPLAFVIAESTWLMYAVRREPTPQAPSPEVLEEVSRIMELYRRTVCAGEYANAGSIEGKKSA